MSSAIDVVAKIAPAIYSRAANRRVGVGGMRRIAMISATMRGGMTRNIARQSTNWVEMPPG
jgi:hypothetical protein